MSTDAGTPTPSNFQDVVLKSKLRTKAESAIDGRWWYGLGKAQFDGREVSCLWFDDEENAANRASLMVSCTPQTILALLAELTTLRTAHEAAQAELEQERKAREGLFSRLNPSVEYVEGTPVGYGEDEIDRLWLRIDSAEQRAADLQRKLEETERKLHAWAVEANIAGIMDGADGPKRVIGGLVKRAADLQQRLDRVEAGPTIAECEAAGRGPDSYREYKEGGLPDTPEERSRFEAYMRGHCWGIGAYDAGLRSYDTVMVRMLYGVWRDRGWLAIRALAAAGGQDFAHKALEGGDLPQTLKKQAI